MMLSGFHPPGHRGVAVIVGVRCKMRRVRRSPPTIRFVSRRSVVVGTAVPVLGDGKMEEAKSALEEARRLNPQLTLKWLQTHSLSIPPLLEGLRKAGAPEE